MNLSGTKIDLLYDVPKTLSNFCSKSASPSTSKVVAFNMFNPATHFYGLVVLQSLYFLFLFCHVLQSREISLC